MTISTDSLLFADANVFIEGLFIQDSAASILIKIISTGTFSIATCKPVIHDVENVILRKLSDDPDSLDTVLEQWQNIQNHTKLKVVPTPPGDLVEKN